MNLLEKIMSGGLSHEDDASMMEIFLEENYRFRRNILSGKPEFVKLSKSNKDEETTKCEGQKFQVFDKIAENSIVRRARIEGITANSPRPHLEEYVFSDAVTSYNPIEEYLNGLAPWDGQDHVAKVLNRVPGLTGEKQMFMRIWLRSMVAHWKQLDTLHGNECVPTLIGAQGCGKSTFVQRLLPKQLRCYYLDHMNLSNKFDKEMALTNNPRPLSDPTGSRLFICFRIPQGEYIDNVGEINYEQFYAQIQNEVEEQKLPYWFNNEEVARIQQLNLDHMAKMDLPDMIIHCFRKPKQNEASMPLSSDNILEILAGEFPAIKCDNRSKIHLGYALKKLGFDRKENRNGMLYYIVPSKAA